MAAWTLLLLIVTSATTVRASSESSESASSEVSCELLQNNKTSQTLARVQQLMYLSSHSATASKFVGNCVVIGNIAATVGGESAKARRANPLSRYDVKSVKLKNQTL